MNHDMIREAHMQMREIKEHWWHHHQEPDPPPALFIKWRDSEVANINCAAMGGMISRVHEKFPMIMEKVWGIPRETPITGALLLYLTLSALADGVPLPGGPTADSMVKVPKGTPMEHIVFNVEGWARSMDDEEAEQHQRGDLEKDFRENPLSDVRETMTTYIVQTSALGTAEWWRATSMFYKDDGGVVVWEDPHIDDSETYNEDEGVDTLLHVMKPFVTRESLA